MVTAIQDNAGYIIGQHSAIDPRKLDPVEWRKVIVHAVNLLTLGYVHGLQSAHQIILRRQKSRESVWQFSNAQLEKAGIPTQTADLLFLAELKELPTWDAWPKTKAGKGYANAKEKVLLYIRTKQPTADAFCFKVLTIEWSLQVDEDADGRVKARQAVARSIELSPVKYLEDLFEKLRSKTRVAGIGTHVLRALYKTQESTAYLAEGRADLARTRKQELSGLLQRAGVH